MFLNHMLYLQTICLYGINFFFVNNLMDRWLGGGKTNAQMRTNPDRAHYFDVTFEALTIFWKAKLLLNIKAYCIQDLMYLNHIIVIAYTLWDFVLYFVYFVSTLFCKFCQIFSTFSEMDKLTTYEHLCFFCRLEIN